MAETLNAEVSRASETGESVRGRVKCTTPDFPPATFHPFAGTGPLQGGGGGGSLTCVKCACTFFGSLTAMQR